MIFKKLHQLIFEETSIDEYEDWVDFLSDNEYNLSKDDVKSLIAKFNISFEFPIKSNKKILHLYDETANSVWLERNDDNEYDVWELSDEKLNDSLFQLDDYKILQLLNINEDDVYIGAHSSNLGDIRENPGKVYHYTTEDKWDQIQEAGGMITSYGTGLTNRGVKGIFTSADPEEHALGTYGDVCLELDLTSYMNDKNLSKLDISVEPEIMEVELRNTLKHVLGLEDNEEEASRDMSPFTLIINHSIPLRNIKRIN